MRKQWTGDTAHAVSPVHAYFFLKKDQMGFSSIHLEMAVPISLMHPGA